MCGSHILPVTIRLMSTITQCSSGFQTGVGGPIGEFWVDGWGSPATSVTFYWTFYQQWKSWAGNFDWLKFFVVTKTFYIHQIFKNLLEKDSKWLQPNCDRITELWCGCRWSCCFGKGDICNFRIQWQSSYLVIEASHFPGDWLETKNNCWLHYT